jgi:hypothetical protein
MRSARRPLLLSAAVAALAACEALFALDGFDSTGSGGSPADGGAGSTGGAEAGVADAPDDGGHEAGPVDAPLDVPLPNPCAGKGDGTQWDTSNYFARCCGGKPTNTDTDPDNCGVCGLKCINGQVCEHENAAFDSKAVYCTGCIGNSCSSGLCCCKTVNTTQGACCPTNCMEQCVACPSGQCQPETSTINFYCRY